MTGFSESAHLYLDTGPGDDVVDATASSNGVSVMLGAGRDRFIPSSHDDSVGTGPAGETDQDVVQLGSSPLSSVAAGAIDNTAPNPDIIMLGPHGGAAWWHGPMAPGARLDGGGGPSELHLHPGSGDVTVDARAGTLIEDGATQISWTGFTDYGLERWEGAPRSLTFIGTDRDEQLTLQVPNAHLGTQRIDLGGGDDSLWIGKYDSRIGGGRSSYDGGAGTDFVAFHAGNSLDLDLASGRMVSTLGGRTLRTTMRGFEEPLVSAKRLVLRGTNTADRLRFYACTATVRGRAGKDVIAQDRGDYFEADGCGRRAFRLHGNSGNDTLRGSTGNDLLVGGPGRDTIVGNGGRDRCSGERLTSCEVTLR